MRAREVHRRAVLPRTAPYVGVAYLALLAIACAYTLPADRAYVSDGQGLQAPPVAWLAGGIAPVAVGGAAALLAQRGGIVSRAPGAQAFPLTPARDEASRVRARLTPIAPLARGALSVPALLVAVTLAICR